MRGTTEPQAEILMGRVYLIEGRGEGRGEGGRKGEMEEGRWSGLMVSILVARTDPVVWQVIHV